MVRLNIKDSMKNFDTNMYINESFVKHHQQKNEVEETAQLTTAYASLSGVNCLSPPFQCSSTSTSPL